MMEFLAWLLSIFIAFSFGAGTASKPKESDDALREKVQGHLDVIMDESAALVDDVKESVHSDERVRKAEQTIRDVREIAEDTAEDLRETAGNARQRIQDTFGPGETEQEPSDEIIEPALTEDTSPLDGEPGQEGTDDTADGTESLDGQPEDTVDGAEPAPDLTEGAAAPDETPAPGDPVHG